MGVVELGAVQIGVDLSLDAEKTTERQKYSKDRTQVEAELESLAFNKSLLKYAGKCLQEAIKSGIRIFCFSSPLFEAKCKKQ